MAAFCQETPKMNELEGQNKYKLIIFLFNPCDM